LLLETGRPLLIPGVVAPSSDFGRRIAIAWKPTPEAARAVGYAMPFLNRAAEVHVLTVEEEEGRRDAAERLLRFLARHGVRAAADRLPPGPDGAAATMLAEATARADFLVIGGYGHTRLREWVFGGFTQMVLDHAEQPVLMAH
jgi:nucleotide-binding universal stress UspA family protein